MKKILIALTAVGMFAAFSGIARAEGDAATTKTEKTEKAGGKTTKTTKKSEKAADGSATTTEKTETKK